MNYHPTLFQMTCPTCADLTLHRLTKQVRTCVWCESVQAIEVLDEPEIVRVPQGYKINYDELNFSDGEDEEISDDKIDASSHQQVT